MLSKRDGQKRFKFFIRESVNGGTNLKNVFLKATSNFELNYQTISKKSNDLRKMIKQKCHNNDMYKNIMKWPRVTIYQGISSIVFTPRAFLGLITKM